ncbi:coenzyme-B sulfoethylthiotransferase subunit beta [Methanotorris formicicus]|uniref:Methyl-coenzyme M reductase subunit beta n=1 Tax=Methanotorris formicicus Mc-S-70 TaxID=647171 RepID=H1KXL9_9EURY|nr:coenzyme-B sulfoethylthiotransferase subunit beta [Methanotorris formicicus]EHP88092.1 methyl-coenzyme M reductase, beta subunit [Methanotorris formicicus Mc-S-70]5N28_B Chain B, Methyl-coenzyme M reductase, beta subunit [Methanotorris formicicus Mc-S-70]5N28_E Chain E, Methyl-coenzyme M reductase, beta subunit [Methanotorris formicicus Mc-S-70]5N2A_B Chain B, Methyl-coenzyme M reductase, beta subunit [Methanotorris formicicus Mc-S-70]
MVKYEDKICLYNAKGELVEENVPLEAISPLYNPTIQKLVKDIKRTVAVNLAGIENALKTGAVGGKACVIPGRTLDLPIVENAETIMEYVDKLLRISPDDDTSVKLINDGKQMAVQLPSKRLEVAAEYSISMLNTAMALKEAIIKTFDVDMFDAPMVHAAILGRYPQVPDYMGANIASLLGAPTNLEGLGYALRNIMVNHYVATTKKNIMNAVAFASIMEQTAMFEMGDAIGSFERLHLLGLAYQGLNADNLVIDLVKANGKNGTVGTVVASIVERALEDGVITEDKKMPSGFVLYKPVDVAKWNAYAAAGLVAAVIVNCGAARAAQNVASTILYYNDIIEYETGLPGVDFGRAEGTAVGFSFFSHSIYGGGGPGIFNGNHIVTRHSKGFAIPPVCAAMCVDAGTQMFSPEKTSALVGAVFSAIDEFREPLKYVIDGALAVKDKI